MPKKIQINNTSIVLKVTYNKISFLFTGDAEDPAEEAMLALKGKIDLKSTIYKAPHHGSDTSSTAVFLNKVSPEVIVICVGRNNKFGHPGESTMARFRDSGAKIYRTDFHGNIKIITDGNQYQIITSK